MGYYFKFSENEVEFNPWSGNFFNYKKFLINEFFNSSEDEIVEIMKGYQNKFGLSSYNYVMKNYFNHWRNGYRILTNLQEERIFTIMPDYLNEKALETLNQIKKDAIQKLGVEEVNDGVKRTVNSFFRFQQHNYSSYQIKSTEDIHILFDLEVKRAYNLNLVGPFCILDDNERKELEQLSKYIVLEKLQYKMRQIQNDLNTVIPLLSLIQNGNINSYYNIYIFNLKINLVNFDFTEVKVPEVAFEDIVSNNRFKEYYDKIMVNKLIDINFNHKKVSSNAFLNKNDITLFINHYNEISNRNMEIITSSIFQGEGGEVNINIKMKPIMSLKIGIFKSLSKILLYTIILFVFFTFTIVNNWIAVILYIGIILVGFYIGLVQTEIEKIKDSNKEIKLYGK
jgi:hypothetical protein